MHRLTDAENSALSVPASTDKKRDIPTGISNLSRGVMLSAALALGACDEDSKPIEASPVSQEAVLPETEVPTELPKVKKGDWHFEAREMSKIVVTDDFGPTLYAFIKGELQKPGVFQGGKLEEFERPLIDGIIALCKQLNPLLDLDNFNSINGQTLEFPSVLFMAYGADQSVKNKSDLIALAKFDGFQVGQADEMDATFTDSRSNGLKIEKVGQGFFRPKGYDQSASILRPDALDVFETAAASFESATRFGSDPKGWSLAYTHVLRDSALTKAQKLPLAEDLHSTGRAVNVSAGRFLSPKGEEVTWSGNPEWQVKIGADLQPALLDAFITNGAAVYVSKDAGFLDIYFPETHEVQFSFKRTE